MHRIGWYGSGNGLSDAGREIAEIRARTGRLLLVLYEYEEEEKEEEETSDGDGDSDSDGDGERRRRRGRKEAGATAILDSLDLVLWRHVASCGGNSSSEE